MIFNSLFFLLVGYVFLGIDFFNCVSVTVLIINYFVVDISSSNLTTTKKVSIMERLNVLSIRDEKKMTFTKISKGHLEIEIKVEFFCLIKIN